MYLLHLKYFFFQINSFQEISSYFLTFCNDSENQKMDVSERAINGSAIGPTWHQINFLLEPWSVLTCDRTAWKKVRLLNGTENTPSVGKFRDIEMGAILIMSTLDLNGYLGKNTRGNFEKIDRNWTGLLPTGIIIFAHWRYCYCIWI